MKLGLLILFCALGSALAGCDRQAKPDRDGGSSGSNVTCVRDGAMFEIRACGVSDLGREELRRRQYLQLARQRAREADAGSTKYGPQTHEALLLEASEEAFHQYLGTRCEKYRYIGGGGTMINLDYHYCLAGTIQRRTHDLWADYLTYADSTPPMLPEPTKMIAQERAEAGLN